jgi:PAS domain S-box-containing protein
MCNKHNFYLIKALFSIIPFGLLLIGIFSVYYHFDVSIKRMKFNQQELYQLNIHKQNITKIIESISIDLNIFFKHYQFMFERGNSLYDEDNEIVHEMLMYCSSKLNYNQLRILDMQGMEIKRVNCKKGQPQFVSKQQLQDKSQQEYYLNALKLKVGEVYVSPLSLNIEHGKVQTPITPMVRLITPLANKSGEKLGFVIINYNAQHFIHFPKNTADDTSIERRNIFLINSEGVSYNPLPENLTQNMGQSNDKGFSLAENYPGIWQKLKTKESNSFSMNNSLINSISYYPPGQDIPWKIVSYVPYSQLTFSNKQFFIKLSILVPLIFTLFLMILYFILKSNWQQKVADKNLNANRIYLEAIMNNMVDGIITIDMQGLIYNANSAFINLYNCPIEQLIGKSLSYLFPHMGWNSNEETLDWIKTNISNEKPYREEIFCHTKNGKKIPLEVTFSQAQTTHSPFYILFIRDLSQQKKQEKKLHALDLKYRHREKIAEVGVLVGGILHEVSNPMAAIEGLLLDLRDNQKENNKSMLNKASEENIDIIIEHISRVKNISHEISTFLKPDSNQLAPLDLNSVINSAISLLSYDKRWNHIELEMQLDKQLPVISGISDQLTQVLINLLTNAADAYANMNNCKHGIKISTRRFNHEMILLSVEDKASGMSKEISSQIFQQFYTTKDTGKGTGLGLSLCETIINEHNGNINVESEIGKGTTFRIYLPIDIDYRDEQLCTY